MIETRNRRVRRGALVLTGAAALVAAGCRPGGVPTRPQPTTPTVPPSSAPATTAPGGDHGHGGGDHGDDHGSGPLTTVPLGGGGESHNHSMPARLNHPPTPEQKARAQKLIEDTKKAVANPVAPEDHAGITFGPNGYYDVENAKKAGYVSIGDEMSGVVHYDQPLYHHDGRELDPQHIETLVYKVEGAKRTLITAMYTMEPGATMDTVPDIAGNLTVWHDHSNLCFTEPGSFKLSGIYVNGKCVPGGVFVQTPPMLHVWVTDNPCGPFAGTDVGQRTGSCTKE